MNEHRHLCTATTHLQCGIVRCVFYDDHAATGVPHRAAISTDAKVKYGYPDPWVEWSCAPVAYAQTGKR